MKSYNFIVCDLVKNAEGELLAVSRGNGGWLNYHRTIADGAEIDEDRTDYYFKRKSDIKKVRASKEKERMIDQLNLWILHENVSFMGRILEKASDELYTFAERNNINVHGDRWYEDLIDSYPNVAEAAKLLDRGSNAYSNFLRLTFKRGGAAYNMQLEREPDFWDVVLENRGKVPY